MGDYRTLEVWRLAHEVALAIYRETGGFPGAEKYGLTSQLRRAAASIPANLAEGCGRDSDHEIARFVRVALGSANELEYHLLLSRDLGYLSAERHADLSRPVDRVKRMLASLAVSVVAMPRQALTASADRRPAPRPPTDDR